MSGPEHYAKAEQLLGTLTELLNAVKTTAGTPDSVTATALVTMVVHEAQVHATLALAAATDRTKATP